MLGVSGDITDVAQQIKEYLPPECQQLADMLEYQYEPHEEKHLRRSYSEEYEDALAV